MATAPANNIETQSKTSRLNVPNLSRSTTISRAVQLDWAHLALEGALPAPDGLADGADARPPAGGRVGGSADLRLAVAVRVQVAGRAVGAVARGPDAHDRLVGDLDAGLRALKSNEMVTICWGLVDPRVFT